MECSKICVVIFTSLILITAGFVLTLTGWFAPPISKAVINVRMAGPGALLVGTALLIISCIMCAYSQEKCCSCCYKMPLKSQDLHHHGSMHQTDSQASPLLLQDMKDALDGCDKVRQNAHIGGKKAKKHRVDPEKEIAVPIGTIECHNLDLQLEYLKETSSRSKKSGANGVSIELKEINETSLPPLSTKPYQMSPSSSPRLSRTGQRVELPRPGGYKHIVEKEKSPVPHGSPVKVHVHMPPSTVTLEPVQPPPYNGMQDSTL